MKWALVILIVITWAKASMAATGLLQRALDASLRNQNSRAELILNKLISSRSQVYSKDQLHLDLARVYYQDGKLSQALSQYKSVAKNSDYWLEALEERAWTELRMHQPGHALGDLKTALVSPFNIQAIPETYYLQAYIDLENCDYAGVFKTIAQFKTLVGPRLKRMEMLEKTGSTPEVATAVTHFLADPQSRADAEVLPLDFYRDPVLQRDLRARLGYQAQERLQAMARVEIQDIASTIRKLHIVEAEVIERVHLPQTLASKKKTQTVASSDQIRFPFNGEVWADELGHYTANVRGCTQRDIVRSW